MTEGRKNIRNKKEQEQKPCIRVEEVAKICAPEPLVTEGELSVRVFINSVA